MNVGRGPYVEGRVQFVEVVDHTTRTLRGGRDIHAPKNVLIAVKWCLIPE